jgi:hypothetical protein
VALYIVNTRGEKESGPGEATLFSPNADKGFLTRHQMIQAGKRGREEERARKKRKKRKKRNVVGGEM